MPDYYAILGISREASLDEIKRAYRLKAKMFHPDVNKSADAVRRFEEINEAYQALMNGNHGEHEDTKQPFDAAQYKKYGSRYNSRQTGYTGSYSTNSQSAKEQAEADELDRKFNRIQKVWERYKFHIMLPFGVAAIIFGIMDSRGMGFGLIGLFYIVTWFQKLYQSKQKIKQTQNKS